MKKDQMRCRVVELDNQIEFCKEERLPYRAAVIERNKLLKQLKAMRNLGA